MREIRMTVLRSAAWLALALLTIGCGGVYDYSPAGVSHNSDKFGKSTGQIDKEINKSLQKMTDRFNLVIKRYLGLKISKVIADMLERNNLEQEDLDLFLDEGEVEGEERAEVYREYHLLMAASEAQQAEDQAEQAEDQAQDQADQADDPTKEELPAAEPIDTL